MQEQLGRARQDLEIFRALRGVTDWRALDPNQAWALVAAERRGLEYQATDRKALIAGLR